jgi:UDP-N-acetylmuramoylalanine--D-glutamate ligase
MIHHILNGAGIDNVLLGNIGIPPFEKLDLIREDTIIVFELSAHQLERIDTSPSTAVLLNVFPEHLDFFTDFDHYFAAKTNLFRHQHGDDILILHRSLANKVELPDAYLQLFSIESAPHAVRQAPLKVIGKHNENNVLAALMAAGNYGISFDRSIGFLKDFNPLPHRLEYIGKFREINFYNDSISTVPESTIAAVNALEDTDTLILGGYDRGLDYTELIGFLIESQVRNFILLGQVGKVLYKSFQEKNIQGKQFFYTDSLREAMPLILQHTQPGRACLLSPAASSYDQFHNFEHRGDTFKALVKSIDK